MDVSSNERRQRPRIRLRDLNSHRSCDVRIILRWAAGLIGGCVALVPKTQIFDASLTQRHSKNEVEVYIVQGASRQLLTFQLNGQPVVKLASGEAVVLYLNPSRYRFGVVPSHFSGDTFLWQTNADVSRNPPQVYLIFQSAGFTSSGGGAVYEIKRVDAAPISPVKKRSR